MRLEFSTDDLPERDRFPYWADAMHDHMGVRRLPLPDASGPFHARMSARSIGALVHLRADTDSHRIVRQTQDIAKRSWNTYWIFREASHGTWASYGGHENVSENGDLWILDSDVPFEAQATTRFSYDSWLVPKHLLNPYLAASGRPLRTRLSHRSGVGALAASYLDSLTRNAETLPEATIEPAVDTLARLIGIACGAEKAEAFDAVRAGRLQQAKRHIGRHLADPDLSPITVASSLGVSVRTLHEAFEPAGTSFGRYVQRRRLEECRAALLANPGRPVMDIAFCWGFSSLSSFYRAFQAAFGASPGDLRAACRAEHLR
jgi:AraC-like DNA-binding protein